MNFLSDHSYNFKTIGRFAAGNFSLKRTISLLEFKNLYSHCIQKDLEKIMHFGICTYGSRGDTQPYIALALGLKSRGHVITLFANENFSGMITCYNIDFCPLPGDMEEVVHSPEVLGILRSGNMIRFLRELQKVGRKFQPAANAAMLKGASGVDVLVASPLAMIWVYSIAEKLGKKWAVVQLSLPTVPTREFPFAGLSFFDFSLYNIFTYKLIHSIYWKLNKKDVNGHRALLGLPALKTPIQKKMNAQKILNLYALSPSLISRPDDWPDEVQLTGFFAISQSQRIAGGNEEPDAKLIEWLAAGAPPIYIGFGSIPIPDTDRFSGILHELLDNTNERIIFCQGWSELPDLPRHENLFAVKAINHEWLFPRCKAAVIHGGIGTLAAVLHAKIPAIVVSIFGDQPIWGKFIQQKDLGVHIPFKKLTTKKLLDAIEISQMAQVKHNANIMGEKLQNEDGVTTGVEMLEKYFGTLSQPAQLT